MMLLVASIGVALVAFIIYALERRSKSEAIVWEDALKISLFGGILSAGIVLVSTTDVVKDVASNVEMPLAQEMFVGTPSF